MRPRLHQKALCQENRYPSPPPISFRDDNLAAINPRSNRIGFRGVSPHSLKAIFVTMAPYPRALPRSQLQKDAQDPGENYFSLTCALHAAPSLRFSLRILLYPTKGLRTRAPFEGGTREICVSKISTRFFRFFEQTTNSLLMRP